MPVKPSWDDFRRIGAEIVESVDGACSFEEIAAELGLSSRQQAYHICCVAAGKLAYRARKALSDDPRPYPGLRAIKRC